MNITPTHLEALKAFGYTEVEAQFLYLVATHGRGFDPQHPKAVSVATACQLSRI